LRETEMQPGSLLSPTEPGPFSGARSSWSTYVPRKLKTNTSSKLRPTMLNPVVVAKEAYYKRKLELLEAAEVRESCERINKAKREEEEHKKNVVTRFRNPIKTKTFGLVGNKIICN
jgi:hypothetical protein